VPIQGRPVIQSISIAIASLSFIVKHLLLRGGLALKNKVLSAFLKNDVRIFKNIFTKVLKSWCIIFKSPTFVVVMHTLQNL
jgi:hypothetical protein